MGQGSDGLALVEEMAARFGRGDMPGAFELLHDEFTIEQPASLPHGGSYAGSAGMVEMGTAFAEHWEREITDPRRHACDEIVVQLTTQTWTSKATGRSATVDVVELFTFRDDRIASIRVFQHDTHLLLTTLDPG